jgi:glycosyltransferase involved in cell wall biosynthesis
VVEALALGVPVLISDKVNIWREIVDDGAGLADSDTREGTVTALRKWFALSAEQRTSMKMHAVACYQKHFHMASAAQRLIEVVKPHTRYRHEAITRQGIDSQP